MLKRLYVDNYKCLVNFEAHFGEITLLLGPNGVGKSAVLDVVFAVRQLLSGVAKIDDARVFPTRTLTRWQSRPVQVFEMEAKLAEENFIYRLELEHDPDNRRARIQREVLHSNGRPLFEFKLERDAAGSPPSGLVQLYKDSHEKGPQFAGDWSESALARVAPTGSNRRLTSFLGFARRMLVCGLYPGAFVAEAATEDRLLLRDGSNFAAWYRHIFQERQDLVPAFSKALEQVIDGFRGVRLAQVGTDTRAFLAVFQEGDSRFELRLDELSDGQRALIAVHALVHLAAGQGYSLFLDEPDNYVALAEIQPWLLALEDACGRRR